MEDIIESNKQSFWCEITLSNYTIELFEILITDDCPICKKNNIICKIYDHKHYIKYFDAYSYIRLKEMFTLKLDN